MFTLLHPFVGFLLVAPIRKRLIIIAFFLGAMLPDLEGLYFMSAAFKSCEGLVGEAFRVCAKEFPSHELLHSFPGALIIGAVVVGIMLALSRLKILERQPDVKIVFLSSVLGTIMHLSVDIFYHGGADGIALFYPIGWRPSLAVLGLEQYFVYASLIAVPLFFYLYRREIVAEIKK